MPTTAKSLATRAPALAAVAIAGLLLAAPAAAAPSAEDRLGACLVSGSAGAPGDSLMSAITAVRSLCYTQIKRVRADRLEAVDARFERTGERLTREQRDERDRARDAATRQLNDEIARVIAAHTGLTQ